MDAHVAVPKWLSPAFFCVQVSLVYGGDTLQIHIGQGSVGQQIKPENRLFELSGRKKDCPGTELKLKLD